MVYSGQHLYSLFIYAIQATGFRAAGWDEPEPMDLTPDEQIWLAAAVLLCWRTAAAFLGY
jgi:hypothetical protein